MNGHLEVLKYLHQNGCPWNEDACLEAAECGHFEILKYLLQNGCPWNEEACLEAAKRNGHLKVVKWFTTTVLSNGREYLSNQDIVLFQDRKRDRNDDDQENENKRKRRRE